MQTYKPNRQQISRSQKDEAMTDLLIYLIGVQPQFAKDGPIPRERLLANAMFILEVMILFLESLQKSAEDEYYSECSTRKGGE